MYRVFIAFLLFSFFIDSSGVAAQAKPDDYGLYIQGYPASDSRKTSLLLENGEDISLNKDLSLSFKILVRPENVFGMVSRIITDEKEVIDFLFTVGEDGKRYPILMVNDKIQVVKKEIVLNKWITVKMALSVSKREVSLNYDGSSITLPVTLKGAGAKFSLGVCSIPGFGFSDVASVNIKDIRVFKDNKEWRYWPLKDYDEANKTFDVHANAPAVTKNAQWLIDSYSIWKTIYSEDVKNNTQFAFDGKHTFYIASPDSKEVILFDVRNNNKTSLAVNGGYQVANITNAAFFDKNINKMVTYNLEESKVSAFSVESKTWSASVPVVKEPLYMNNTAVYNDEKGILYSFGGYGFYKYNRDLIALNITNGQEKKNQIADIYPRFASSSVLQDGKLYVFGGRGNKTGRQELSPHNFYDLYSVDLIMGQATKLWESEAFGGDFLPGENMVYDKKDDCFYVFTTKHGGTLIKINKNNKGHELVSFPIRESLEGFFLYTNLWYSETEKKFYAIIYKKVDDYKAKASVFSLDYPPVPVKNLHNVGNNIKLTNNYKMLLVLSGAVIIAVFAFAIYRKKSKPANNHKDIQPIAGKEVQKLVQPKVVTTKISYYDFSKNSICFLGGFKVRDSEGNDITVQFSPILKLLLVLLTVHSDKENQGISGNQMLQLLWFDKDETAAKNNRNVYVSRLRSVFEPLGGLDVVSQNGIWKIVYSGNIHCDYIEVKRLITELSLTTSLDKTQLHQLLEVLQRGVLLPNLDQDWLDSFKSDFSNKIIDLLVAIWNNNNQVLEQETQLQVADILMLHDPIHEQALYIKCSILFKQGKRGLAKNAYDNFVREYLRMLELDYEYTLSEVIEGKNMR